MSDVQIIRKYKNEDTLIIGCGNSPTSEYYTDHMHVHNNCYTIDPNSEMNPSIIGRFGIQDMLFLGKGLFKEIVFEGFMLNCFKYRDQQVDEEKIKQGIIFMHEQFLKDYHKYKNTDYIETDNICTINNCIALLQDKGVVSFSNDGDGIRNQKYIKKGHTLVNIEDPNISLDNDSPEQFYLFSEGKYNV